MTQKSRNKLLNIVRQYRKPLDDDQIRWLRSDSERLFTCLEQMLVGGEITSERDLQTALRVLHLLRTESNAASLGDRLMEFAVSGSTETRSICYELLSFLEQERRMVVEPQYDSLLEKILELEHLGVGQASSEFVHRHLREIFGDDGSAAT